MKKVNVEDIKPGMILAEDIKSPRGQVLARVGEPVTAQQLLHMSYYGIDIVQVQDEDDVIDELGLEAPDDFVGESQSWRIQNSAEYKDFKRAYKKCAAKLKEIVDDFINNKSNLRGDDIIEDIHGVFERHATGLGIMSMMLNIQEIDDDTYEHSVNVAIISRVLGGWLGIKDPDELDVLTIAGLFHDIGKSQVPESILKKPGKLTTEEFFRMAEHPVLGYTLLQDQELDRRIKLAALQHHERCDGSGYPYGLTRTFIAPFSRVVAIADVYDAMTSDRVYRAGICPFEVIAQFKRQRANKYDVDMLMVFLSNIAQSYIGTGVILSDGSRGIITMVNKNALASPLIKIDDGSFIDLEDRNDLFIRALI
ncbi:MAG: HD-GYP domain-containing protein [Pseudobutyrivibrio sp.]|nr:HD-GYP domain-containing protein [Pseudobutyrivibrio sp.]